MERRTACNEVRTKFDPQRGRFRVYSTNHIGVIEPVPVGLQLGCATCATTAPLDESLAPHSLDRPSHGTDASPASSATI
jgi:hypothetical protein